MRLEVDGGVRTIIAVVALLVLVNLSQLFTSRQFGWGVVVLFAGILVYIAKKGGLSYSDIGLGKKSISKGLLLGGAAALAIVLVLLVAYFIDSRLFLDRRYHNVLSSALFGAFISIPLHTVLAEELAFRGVLWASLKRVKGTAYATVASSILFGLWHIVPSLGISQSSGDAASLVGGGVVGQILSIFGVVVATTGAGIAFCELRRRSGSLVAPVMAHWAINGAAIVFASLAWAK